MSITTKVSPEADEITIAVEGRFDFSLQQEFRDAYRRRESPPGCFRVNLAGAEYLDSSALGMLLLLREHAEKSNSSVVIEQPSAQIRRTLEIARFNKLFTIVPAS